MKTKRSSDLVVKIFLVVVAVILVGLLIAWSTGVFKDKQRDLNRGTEKIDSALSSMAEFDLLVYDGYTIKGEALVELIEEYKSREITLAIGVKTLGDKDTTYYNYSFTSGDLGAVAILTPPTEKNNTAYITPSGNFLGEVIKNRNNEIVCITFTQQK